MLSRGLGIGSIVMSRICAFGLALWCVVGLPGVLGLILAFRVRFGAVLVVAIGYAVQMGLAAAAICAREPSNRHRIYLVFRGLLIIDVVVAWFLPFLYVAMLGIGE